MQLHGSLVGIDYTNFYCIKYAHQTFIKCQFDFKPFLLFLEDISSLPPIIDVPSREVDYAPRDPYASAVHLRELNRAVDDFEAALSLSSRNSQSSQNAGTSTDTFANSTASSLG